MLQEVEDSVTFTNESPFPEPSVAFADLYTEPLTPSKYLDPIGARP